LLLAADTISKLKLEATLAVAQESPRGGARLWAKVVLGQDSLPEIGKDSLGNYSG
jgi:hypothetical protein